MNNFDYLWSIYKNMAILIEDKKCFVCGDVIAEAQYEDQSNLPIHQRIIGNTFIGWKHKKCNCNYKKMLNK